MEIQQSNSEVPAKTWVSDRVRVTAAEENDNGEDSLCKTWMFHSSRFPQASFNPTQIFADDVTEEKGENARLSAFVGAIAVGDLVKSTLGPKGMDKILQSAYVRAQPPEHGLRLIFKPVQQAK